MLGQLTALIAELAAHLRTQSMVSPGRGLLRSARALRPPCRAKIRAGPRAKRRDEMWVRSRLAGGLLHVLPTPKAQQTGQGEW